MGETAATASDVIVTASLQVIRPRAVAMVTVRGDIGIAIPNHLVRDPVVMMILVRAIEAAETAVDIVSITVRQLGDLCRRATVDTTNDGDTRTIEATQCDKDSIIQTSHSAHSVWAGRRFINVN